MSVEYLVIGKMDNTDRYLKKTSKVEQEAMFKNSKLQNIEKMQWLKATSYSPDLYVQFLLPFCCVVHVVMVFIFLFVHIGKLFVGNLFCFVKSFVDSVTCILLISVVCTENKKECENKYKNINYNKKIL